MSRPTRKDFDVIESERPLGPNLPQRIGRLLWAPMLAMGLMAFPVALALALVRASYVAGGTDAPAVAALGQFVPAAMFLGFASVFAAISFAIARILGVLRVGGGQVQAACARRCQTLRMPITGHIFIGLMATAMMALLGAVAAHVVLGFAVATALAANDAATVTAIASWSEILEAVRRLGASTYLLSIAFGLATIVKVLTFQSVRIRELPAAPRLAG